MHKIDPSTGLITDTTEIFYPSEDDVITSLEYVGSTLSGGMATEFEPNTDTVLVTLDISSGEITTIGATGVGSPLGGLAWDGTTMYAISAGGSTPILYTIDLDTGVATQVGEVTFAEGGSVGGLTALEFGGDGELYSLPNINWPTRGHLLSIDPLTAKATDLGDMGGLPLVALTSNADTGTVSVSCQGFQSPMANHPVKAKKNRVFPLKMELFDYYGLEVIGDDLVAPPVVQVVFDPVGSDDAIDVSDDVLSSGQGSDGNQFEFTDDGIWQFNLKSKNYTASGVYIVTVVSGDESEYRIDPACVTSFEVN